MFSLDHALPPATRILGRTESIGFHAAVARAHGVDEVLLQLCSPSAFEVELVGRGTVRHYPAGARCSPQGDVAEAIHYLQRGKLKLSLVSPRGKEAVIAIVDAEAFFGEGCLAGHRGRTSTATTITACTVVRIHKPAIAEMLHEQLCFADAFIAHLLSRNVRIEEDLTDQLFNSSEKRLARVFVMLASYGNDGQPEAVLEQLSQQTFADMIGTTRSRVSFFMNRFRKRAVSSTVADRRCGCTHRCSMCSFMADLQGARPACTAVTALPRRYRRPLRSAA